MQPNKSIIANETSSAFTPASELAVSPNSNDPYAGDVPYELAVSPKSNDPSAGDVTAVSASNVIPPEPIEGKPPNQAWLAKHQFDGVDFTLPNPDSESNDPSAGDVPYELAVSPKSNDPSAGDVPYGLAVSPKSNDPSAGDVTAVSASNDIPREPIEGKPPDQAWLAEHKFDGVDFTLPSPDSSKGPFHLRRRLQGKVTTWSCHRSDLKNKPAGSVQIWWGHTAGDAAWACNEWHTACFKGKCTAYQVTQSHWNCYRQSDLKFVGQASIWWGHGVGDGVWACNSWVSDCGNSQGGCLVTGAPHWDDDRANWVCSAYRRSDGCSGGLPHEQEALKFACDQHDYCYYGPIKNDFWDTYKHCTNLFYAEVLTKHWGLFDWYRITGESWRNFMTWDPIWQTGNPVNTVGFGNAFQDQQLASDQECSLGKSKPQGYQWAPCKSGGGCVAGTSCYNCCAGDDGFTCMKPWWEP